MCKEPRFFQGKKNRLVEHMDKVEEQAPVLPVEILDAETALLLRQNNLTQAVR
jgi:hypothetical protein